MAANPPWMAIPPWTRDDDKRFELAFLRYNGDLVLIAQHLKTPLAVVKYYHDALLHDLDLIESGKYALPDYPDDDYVSDTEAGQFKYKDNERKRGIPWSQEEHGECDGLDKFGKGDWKSIARRCVKSRTATQVASHAQKYFLRRNSDAKTRKRSSIHDIITMGDDDNVTVPGSNLQPQFGDQIPPDYYQS